MEGLSKRDVTSIFKDQASCWGETALGGDTAGMRKTSQKVVAIIQGRVHGDLGRVVTVEVRSLLLDIRRQRKA